MGKAQKACWWSCVILTSPVNTILSLLPVFLSPSHWLAPGAQLEGARELFGQGGCVVRLLAADHRVAIGKGSGLQVSCNKSNGSKLWQ